MFNFCCRTLFSLMLVSFIAACSDSPAEPVPGTTPGVPLEVTANALELSSEADLRAEISWLAQTPYTQHSVYLGDHADTWQVVVEDINDGVVNGSGTETTISTVVDVPLTEQDQEGYLCVVSWNHGLFIEVCNQNVVFPALPGTPSDVEIIFGDQPPPWAALQTIPDSVNLFTDSKEGETTAQLVAVVYDEYGSSFVCADIDENNLRGWIEVVVEGNYVEEIYVANNYTFYTDFSCSVEWGSSNTEIVSVEANNGVVVLNNVLAGMSLESGVPEFKITQSL